MRSQDNNITTYASGLGLFAALVTAVSFSAFAAEVGTGGAVTWRSLAVEPDPSCTFANPVQGQMAWDALTDRFNVTSAGTVVLTYTNIANVRVSRDAAIALEGGAGTTIAIDGTLSTLDATLIGSVVDHGDFDTTVGGVDHLGGWDTTGRTLEDAMTISLAGSIALESDAQPVVGETYTVSFAITCDDGT